MNVSDSGGEGKKEEHAEEVISREEVETACRVLEYFAGHLEEYKQPENRQLRAALQPLFNVQKESMFGASGLSSAEYHAEKRQKERRKQEKNRIKLENERLLKLTALRAGRIRRLENLKESTGESIALVMDGVAEDGVNTTLLHSDQQKSLGNVNASSPETNNIKYATNSFRSCYICKRRYQELHHFYDSLCPSCAKFNWKKRLQTCDMSNKICLVTGGRVKIGFQCCLKLLRCGATVIATSRFPCDAAKRFAAQTDFDDWKDRIHVYGLDLRDLAYVEAFCDMTMKRYSHVDVIINNACQTIRRPPVYYQHLIEVEEKLMKCCRDNRDKIALDSFTFDTGDNVENELLSMLVGDLNYRDKYSIGHARLSDANNNSVIMDKEFKGEGEANESALGTHMSSAQLSQVPLTTEDVSCSSTEFPTQARDINNQQIDLRRKHSWLLHMHEISTPEVAEVFAINSISPFVMIARLKPALAKNPIHSECLRNENCEDIPYIPSLAEYILQEEQDQRKKKSNQKKDHSSTPYCKGGVSCRVHHADCSFVVNVSSMEGKFYRRKMEAHPHTNMAKAALNMMTRTAADDYKRSNIFMTAVDTGWINDENPLEIAVANAEKHNFGTPLDEVDAAARILDPIIYPLRKGSEQVDGGCSPFYGCFLKDYFLSEW